MSASSSNIQPFSLRDTPALIERNLARDLEALRSEEAAARPPQSTRFRRDRPNLERRAGAWLRDFNEAYEYLIKFFADSAGKKAGEFYTPADVVRVLVEIVDPQPGMSMYDPTCGSGGMRIQTRNYVAECGGNPKDLSFYGQESIGTTWSICKMNMLLHNIPDADIRQEDTLRKPQHKAEDGELKLFDRILANPPFSRLVPHGEIESEEWNCNIRRYVDNAPPPEPHDVSAHLHGGVPLAEIDGLSRFWNNYPGLRESVLEPRIDTDGHGSKKQKSKSTESSSIRVHPWFLFIPTSPGTSPTAAISPPSSSRIPRSPPPMPASTKPWRSGGRKIFPTSSPSPRMAGKRQRL